ncbi:RHS repeat-associated core domain-containing protein [Pseudomonas xanthosomatis]|uniref:RHS repeat-associated core domain-containing protein n=1 Tax=Pseudomonas xanthosomatis TaxID=2842356 RepID=UPI001CEDD286|nr:RHS repeat-associated core domain-containing protein [Pseudomonas xanthosomatis]
MADFSSALVAVDTQGSMLFHSSGHRLKVLSYTPYGCSTLGHCPLLLGFMGELFQKLAGGYHLGNGYRCYSPALMRFYRPDDISPFGRGGINAYAAFSGDPVNNVDPSGHDAMTMTFFRAVSRFKSALVKGKGVDRNKPLLTDAHPEDSGPAIVRLKRRGDVKGVDFKLIVRKSDVSGLIGEERKFILLRSGELITGNQQNESFPHPALKYFSKTGGGVISAGYLGLRYGVVVFSHVTGHYHSSMKGHTPTTSVIEFFNRIGVVAMRVRGKGDENIPPSYNPWFQG